MRLLGYLKKHPALTLFALLSLLASSFLFFARESHVEVMLMGIITLIALCWLIIAVEVNGKFGAIMLAYLIALGGFFYIDSKLVIKRTDEYAKNLILDYPCQPLVKELLNRNEGWHGFSESPTPKKIQKNIHGIVATRRLIYQETGGLFSYGFFDDPSRSFKFPSCENSS